MNKFLRYGSVIWRDGKTVTTNNFQTAPENGQLRLDPKIWNPDAPRKNLYPRNQVTCQHLLLTMRLFYARQPEHMVARGLVIRASNDRSCTLVPLICHPSSPCSQRSASDDRLCVRCKQCTNNNSIIYRKGSSPDLNDRTAHGGCSYPSLATSSLMPIVLQVFCIIISTTAIILSLSYLDASSASISLQPTEIPLERNLTFVVRVRLRNR